jgi:hypothetical protein
MYSVYEISLVIIAFIALYIYLHTTSKSNECESEENFGNFINNASSSPIIAFINSKYNSTKDINIKKDLYIPKIFSNNTFYPNSDYSRISRMSLVDLSSYVKNNNQLYFIDLLNQFTQDTCGPSEYKLLLTMFANNYIQFRNIEQETNDILSKHITLYFEVKKAQKLYNNMLKNRIDQNGLNQTITQIDLILSNVIQQIPPIINTINKIKTLKYNNTYENINEIVDKKLVNTYKNLTCASISIDTITGSKSRLLNQIKLYNQLDNRNKFNNNNIEFWIPFYVKIHFTSDEISKSNDIISIYDVFTTIIFPKIFNFSLTLIDLMNELKEKQNNKTFRNAVDFFNKYVSSYLIIYIDVVTEQSDSDVLLELQDLESQVSELYDLIMAT